MDEWLRVIEKDKKAFETANETRHVAYHCSLSLGLTVTSG